MLTNTERAYIAGLIDGEGCFTIHHKRGTNVYVPTITVTMTHEPTINWLRLKLGSSYRVVVRHDQPQHRNSYLVRLHGQRAIALARTLLEFFITKRDQAQAFIDLADTYERDAHNRTIPIHVAARERLRLRVKDLNCPPVQPISKVG